MASVLDRFVAHARIQFLRHLRSPVIWVLALAAPIAARYLLPKAGADYSVMAVNGAYLELAPAVIGFQLGVVMAVILSPLAYIFLRAGPTRTQPWQADDMTPARRSVQMLAHWVADTGALWILMLVLGLAGVLLSAFRLPLSDVRPFQTLLALSLIAAPALAVIAGLRTVFSARRGLRGAGGDVVFFLVWLAMLIMAASYFATGVGGSPMLDVLGIAAPLSGATDQVISELILIGSASYEETVRIDALAGVLSSDFLLSRLFWIGMTAVAVMAAGAIYAPHRFKPLRRAASAAGGPASFSGSPISPAQPIGSFIPLLLSDVRLLARPHWLAIVAILVALAGIMLPFRGMVGAALSLLLIFPLTQHGARWRGQQMAALSAVTPRGPEGVIIRTVAAVLVTALLCLPSAMRLVLTGEGGPWIDIVAIVVGLPLIAILLGHLTRSAVAGRLLLLILWYIYLNIGSPPI